MIIIIIIIIIIVIIIILHHYPPSSSSSSYIAVYSTLAMINRLYLDYANHNNGTIPTDYSFSISSSSISSILYSIQRDHFWCGEGMGEEPTVDGACLPSSRHD